MSSDTINEDLITIKTKKALYAAMFLLIKNLCFRKITIMEICQKALISRATFYAYFAGKYDLLKLWIIKFWPQDFESDGNCEQIERLANCHMHDNVSVLKNLVYEADNETFDILFDCILSFINLNNEKNNNIEVYPKKVVLSHYLCQ